jgi:hypothetical protein
MFVRTKDRNSTRREQQTQRDASCLYVQKTENTHGENGKRRDAEHERASLDVEPSVGVVLNHARVSDRVQG